MKKDLIFFYSGNKLIEKLETKKMEYNQTDTDQIINNFQFINENLPEETVTKTYISTASHLFINFGEEFEAKYSNGKPYKKSPWSIWLGANVDWRLNKNDKFIVGSCQSYDEMMKHIQKLVGEKYLSYSITSHLMDIQFEFENGFQLTSFFDALINEQWTIFCPNENIIGLEAETIEETNQIIKLSKNFKIKNDYKKKDLPIHYKVLLDWSLDETDLFLNFEDGFTLSLDYCSWRIEKNQEYYMSIGDYRLSKNKNINVYLDRFKGKRLVRSDITERFHDAKFKFEGGDTISTFSNFNVTHPWRISSNSQFTIYSPKVELFNP